jgi:hypothetical protein
VNQILRSGIDLPAGPGRAGVSDDFQFTGEEFPIQPEADGRQWPEYQRNGPQQQMTLKAGRTATKVVAVGFLEMSVNRLGFGHGLGAAIS